MSALLEWIRIWWGPILAFGNIAFASLLWLGRRVVPSRDELTGVTRRVSELERSLDALTRAVPTRQDIVDLRLELERTRGDIGQITTKVGTQLDSEIRAVRDLVKRAERLNHLLAEHLLSKGH